MKHAISQIETRPHHKPFALGSRSIRSRVLQVILTAGECCFSSLAARGQSLYVANENTNTVTEFNAVTGKTVVAGFMSSGSYSYV